MRFRLVRLAGALGSTRFNSGAWAPDSAVMNGVGLSRRRKRLLYRYVIVRIDVRIMSYEAVHAQMALSAFGRFHRRAQELGYYAC